MPPKKPEKTQQPPSPTAAAATAPPADIQWQLAELTRLVNKYSSRFDKLEGLLKEVKEENSELKKSQKKLEETVEQRDAEILNLRERLNDQEQYVRGWSIRVLGMQLPASDSSDPHRVMQHVYNKLLLPIFKAAQATGQLRSIPDVESVLETAHVLPAKPDTIPAIICRFYTRNIRALVFRLRRDHAPREEPEQGGRGHQRPGRYLFPFYEDLTRLNFAKLRAISQHEKVQSCWSVSGSLRFKLKDDDTVRRVKSVFATVEDIISAK